MTKRMMSWLLVFTLLLAFVPVFAEADGAILTIQTPEELPKAGEEFEVIAELTGNPGFNALQFTLVFDKTVMECVKIKTGELLKETVSANNPSKEDGAAIGAAIVDSVTDDGLIATFSFKAIEDIAEWEFGVKDITLQDAKSNDITYEVVGATVLVEEPEEEILPGGDLAEGWIDDPVDEPIDEPEDEPITTPETGGTVTKPENKDETEATPDGEEETEPLPTFPDTTGHWAETEIGLAAQAGLFKGDEQGNFNPDDDVTRAQFVTVLWRMAGSPAVTEEVPFADIQNQIPEFQSAIAWGYSNGYINGISETEFDPDGTLTREAGMKILHFYSGGAKGNEQMLAAIYDGIFEDSGEISSWAKDSMYWGIYNTLISGTSKTTLSPQGTATRAQLAKILANYIKNFK